MSVAGHLKKTVAHFPHLPGVYLMRDQRGGVIYVGKAKDLRARVRSYLMGGDGRVQIEYLMRHVQQIEKIVTENEEQAFILERDLIKRYKPKYNIRLKDDKAYLSIRINENVEWPRIELVRRVEQDGARYFGPYSRGYELRELLEVIKNVVPLRTCPDSIFYNRQRPCLECQIRRCSGPCCRDVDQEEYRQWVKQAIGIIEGRTSSVIRQLNEEMEQAASDLRFEHAAVLRDRIDVLERFSAGQQVISHHGEGRDVFGLYREGTNAALCVLAVRNGRIADSLTFSFSDARLPDEELLESIVSQFYEAGREIPEEVIIPFDFANSSMLEKVLRQRRGAALDFVLPKRGIRYRLLRLADLNAQHHFGGLFEAESLYRQIAQELVSKLKLRQFPRRIECVDISNLQGTDIVGALVAFYDGVPAKKCYKRYHISEQGRQDDFAAIYEVVTRRLRRGRDEDDLPDLLIIDGGRGQLGKALQVREELGLSTDIVALAKLRTIHDAHRKEAQIRPERIYIEHEAEPIALGSSDNVTHFLQRVRDEAHRFVIGFHRQRRGRRVLGSVLDRIPGVGPERKRRLLRHFGSVKKMRAADSAELAKAGRMPLVLAEKISRILREQ